MNDLMNHFSNLLSNAILRIALWLLTFVLVSFLFIDDFQSVSKSVFLLVLFVVVMSLLFLYYFQKVFNRVFLEDNFIVVQTVFSSKKYKLTDVKGYRFTAANCELEFRSAAKNIKINADMKGGVELMETLKHYHRNLTPEHPIDLTKWK